MTLLEPQWDKRSKLDGPTIRTMVARGFIASGIERPDEINTVMDALLTEGVRQNGQMVGMIAGREHGERFSSATTALHVDQEREAIGILQAASADKSAALTHDQIGEAIHRVAAAKGYDFTSEHGKKQAAIAQRLATGGRAAVAVGASGVGKTTLLDPVIDAHHVDGWQSYGVTLAWRQTRGLAEAGVGAQRKTRRAVAPDTSTLVNAGIEQANVFAMAPFLKRVAEGKIELDRKTLVVIDEIATIDTQQILQLARAQDKYGFKIIGIGDDAQCQAISAGNTIALFRRALGPDQVPELLETIRQRRIADRETAKLLRQGRADLALPRKDAAGLLALVPGSYDDTIKAGVDWLEKRQADNADKAAYKVGVSVPSNADVLAFGVEYRNRQRAAGKLQGEDWVIGAVDQTGAQYDLPLAVGDKVRLFNRVTATLDKNRSGHFGNNGTVAEVTSIDKKYGLRLKRADGTVGAIRWETMQDKDTGRVRLSYGSALTIDARQSETLTDHLTLLPDGSAAIDGHKAYSAGTRAREDDMLIVSHGAEKEEVRNRRPLGDPWLAEATDAEMRQAIIANMARNLSRQPEKGLGVDFLDRALSTNHGGVNTQQAAWFKPPPPAAPQNQHAAQTQEAPSVAAMKAAIEQSKIRLLTGPEGPGAVRRQKRSMRSPAERPKQRTRLQTDSTEARMEARTEFAEALRRSGMRLKTEPVMDGKWHRVAVEGDRGRKMSGRYRGYLDGKPAGFIENYKAGIAERWRSQQPVAEMTAEQHRQREADRMARESERHAAENRAAMRAATAWANAKPVRQHDYLTRKGVQAHGLKQDVKGNLVVPMRDAEGTVRNAQTISRGGEKRFQAGGRKNGLYAQLGTIDPQKPLLIAEGFATAATLREATGMPVVVAFDAGNLQPVAQAIRAKHPDVPMVFAADNDHHLPRRDNPLPNIGKEKAEAAAASVHGMVLMPTFAEKDTGSDWNDYAITNGKAKLAAAIEAQLKSQGISMEKKPTETITPAQREAARKVAAAVPQNQAQQDAMRQQEQQRLQHNKGLSM